MIFLAVLRSPRVADLLQQPTAAHYLTPGPAVVLAVLLTACLWVAGAPRSLGTNRLAPHLGIGFAVMFVAGLLLLLRGPHDSGFEMLRILWLLFGSAASFFIAAFAAGAFGQSFRAGVQATVWTATVSAPLAYALWLPEALRRYAADGALLLDGDGGYPIGSNLGDALFWCLGVVLVIGLPFGVIGAAIGAYITRTPATQPHPDGAIITR